MRPRTLLLLVPVLCLLPALAACPAAEAPPGAPAPAPGEPPAPEPAPPFEELDLEALPESFPEALAVVRRSQRWEDRGPVRLLLDRETLGRSLDLGAAFLVRWQLPAGNFRYLYDWRTGEWSEDDNQVRQAGSLWGIALCHRHRPSPELRAALEKGLRYWFDRTVPGPDGSLALDVPGTSETYTGTVALVALAAVELLRTGVELPDGWREEVERNLDGYLGFLVAMQREDGRFAMSADLARRRISDRTSPYFDGEALLCLAKAARELDRKELVPAVTRAARETAVHYTLRAWREERDSDETKGFFQWGSMAFAEYVKARWPDHEVMGDAALALGWWMIHVHRTLTRTRNHAYAVEGLVGAYRIAEERGDEAAAADLAFVIDRSLAKLTAWQVGGPLAATNPFLGANPTDDPMALGGVMNAAGPSGRPVAQDVSHQLRIDVTQHQLHAVILALESVYR